MNCSSAYVDAFHRHDVDVLVALLRDDAIIEMPPFDFWLQGRERHPSLADRR